MLCSTDCNDNLVVTHNKKVVIVNNLLTFKKKPIKVCGCCNKEHYDYSELTPLLNNGELDLDWYDCTCGSTVTFEKKSYNQTHQARMQSDRSKHNRRVTKIYKLRRK